MARKKSKDTLARNEYGFDFDELTPGEKSKISRMFNAQTSTPAPRSGFIKATIGRFATNGSVTCLLPKGSSVRDLLKQGKFSLDTSKESVLKESTGNTVSLDTKVISGETYAITVEITSA